MAKYLLQEMPDLNKAGQRRVYPKLIANRTLSTKDVVEGLHSYNRALSESVVEAVLTDLSDHLKRMLAMGYSVKLDGIGTCSLALDFDDKEPTEMADDEDRMLYRKVAVKDVNYKVAPELLKQLRMDTELERHSGGVRKLRKQKFTQEERIANALKVIDRNGFITLNDYASLAGAAQPLLRPRLPHRQHRPGQPQGVDKKGDEAQAIVCQPSKTSQPPKGQCLSGVDECIRLH